MDLFDSLLNLEQSYYDEGRREGERDGQRAGYLEGKQFGVQTGIQRFTTVGILQARIESWRKLGNEKVTKHLDQLDKLVSDMPTTNSEADVADFEIRLKKARAKAKVIISVLKDENKLDLHDDKVVLKETEEVIEGN